MAWEAIYDGLSGLGSGIAGGIGRGRDRAQQQAQMDEQRRQFEAQMQVHRDDVAREQAELNRPIPTWQQDAMEGMLGVHTEAKPGLSVDVPSFGMNGGGLSDPSGASVQLRAPTPRPQITQREAKSAQGLISPYAGLVKGREANDARKEVAATNNTARKTIADDKLTQNESQFRRELRFKYDELENRLAVARERGDTSLEGTILKAQAALQSAYVGAQGRVEAGKGVMGDPNATHNLQVHGAQAGQQVEETTRRIRGQAPQTRTSTSVRATTRPNMPQQPQQTSSSDPKRAAAMQWLAANPNDPRAPAIRQKLGM